MLGEISSWEHALIENNSLVTIRNVFEGEKSSAVHDRITRQFNQTPGLSLRVRRETGKSKICLVSMRVFLKSSFRHLPPPEVILNTRPETMAFANSAFPSIGSTPPVTLEGAPDFIAVQRPPSPSPSPQHTTFIIPMSPSS